MSDSTTCFDDPVLRKAVRQAWGNRRAPASLMQLVRGKFAEYAALAAATAIPSGASFLPRPGQASEPLRTPVVPLGTAAVILLAVVAVFWAAASNSAPVAFPGGWAGDLVATHDMCSSKPDHHFVVGVAPDDIAGARDRLAKQLGFPVLSMSADNGWQFRGAGQCRVGAERTAHLLYRRGDITLSVFSVSAADLAGNSKGLESEVDGHQLAGFVRGNTLYCVVEYSPDQSLTPADVRSLIGRLENQVPNPVPGGAVAAASRDRRADTTPIDLDVPAAPPLPPTVASADTP
jgi:hypothetical protein